jgi:hypothetical protein
MVLRQLSGHVIVTRHADPLRANGGIGSVCADPAVHFGRRGRRLHSVFWYTPVASGGADKDPTCLFNVNDSGLPPVGTVDTLCRPTNVGP